MFLSKALSCALLSDMKSAPDSFGSKHMDWYFGNGTEDLVVPKGQELADRLPSPESWSKWGLTAPGNFESFNKCFVTDANLTYEELRFNGKLCNDDEFESSADVKNPSCCSSICGGLSDEYFNQALLQPDYQLDDFARFEQIDDIFLYKRYFWH